MGLDVRVELDHRLVDGAQRRVVEVVGDEELGDVVELARVHEDAADDGLLGLDGVGRRRARRFLCCGERHGRAGW